MPIPADASTTTAVPRQTRMCVRTPAGLCALSRCIPTSPPRNAATTNRTITCASRRPEPMPNVNSCHNISIAKTLRSSTSKETRIHQVPVHQSRRQAYQKHEQYDHLLLLRIRFASERWKEQQEDSANYTERRKRRHLQRVNAFFTQAVPTVIDHRGRK